ncbi:hypothetical protein C0216_02030 [Streptomyces globosus]|uniref:PKD domain-containing protein n=1 Tax=Streptomyces globosus TaxID=68209 RepID=A0A344TUQ9_9ACTN|nr:MULTISPECIES: PKD domain-containing protein [Streptomyces]AXE22380.1 hypothetical protein C0216_02030 [Streptomyces globosus]
MRPTRVATLLTAGLVTLLGMPGAAAAADTPSTLYVDNRDASRCSDAGPGSQAVPYCTLSAAAKVVQPGQTVKIRPGKQYDESVTIDRSGEPGRPIAFALDPVGDRRHAEPAYTRAVTIRGASHVRLSGLRAFGGVTISGAAGIRLEGVSVTKGNLPDALLVEGSTDVQVVRSEIAGVRIAGGSRDTVVSRSMLIGSRGQAVTAVDAPGTILTNNMIVGYCGAMASVGGGSTGSGLFNNVLHNSRTSDHCKSAEPRQGIAVAPGAVEGTRVDYNLTIANAPLQQVYAWSGAVHPTPEAFRAATGQGAHDLLTSDPREASVSLAVDSADATAPGVTTTDYDGYPMSDDPRVPNTGRNGGYLDRGARETHDFLSKVWMDVEPSWAPAGTPVEVRAYSDSKWPTMMSYRVDFGDGSAPVAAVDSGDGAPRASHVYRSPCECKVTVTGVNGGGTTFSDERTVRVTAATPPAAAFTAEPVLPASADPSSHVRPLTVRIDPSGTTAPWPVRFVHVDFGDGSGTSTEHTGPVEHTYARPGTYGVTVTVRDSQGTETTATRRVQVDYAPSAYTAVAPFRLLDSRTTGSALHSGGPVQVALPVGQAVPGHALSGGMAAAVLNVTVTGATEDTHLSVWPSGQPRPATSNVNVRAGGTSSNTVTVPVGADGRIQAQLNSGRAELVVDFAGYYQPGAGHRFTPVAPTRLADTRTAGGALGGGQIRTVKVAGTAGIPAGATAVALNLTGTGATADAHVIAYPDPARRPATSNLNVEPGKDKSNQAIVPVGPDGTITLWTNTGSTHVVVDAVGWYGKDGRALFTPAVPKRLADTRTTGRLAPGATAAVTGLPAGAVGAVLNVTATESTGAGFLTVYAAGAARPAASSVNTRPGDTVPNHVTTPVSGGGAAVWNSFGGSTHVIADLLGHFTQP